MCAISLLISAATACGYSEQEWRWQMDKYERAQATGQEANARAGELQAELETEKKRAARLEEQLRAAGVDIESKSTHVAQLSATVEEQQRAIAEYKERAKQLEIIKARFDTLRDKLNDLTQLGLVVSVRKNRMVVSLPGDVLFDSGKTNLKKDGREILTKVATVIKADATLANRDYQVAGHTDDKKLKGGNFGDNWGLSMMRAREVLLFMLNEGAMPSSKWSASGYADTDPVVPNDTDEGRKKNRRCEIVIMPSVDEMLDLKALATEEPPPPPAPVKK